MMMKLQLCSLVVLGMLTADRAAWVLVCSACFLPPDAMHKRGYSRHAVSVSVRPSVTFVDHVKTNKHIFEIFYHRVATPF